MPLYSVVIPVYNSEKSLNKLYERIRKTFDGIIRQPFELILVDDCSKDGSYEVIRGLAKADKRVKGVQLAVNHGQQKAVLCGFRYVDGDYVVTMDDDLQHPPEEIPKLIEKMESSDDIDVVIGAYDTKKHSTLRRFGTWLMALSNDMIFKKPKNLKMTSFRLVRRYVTDSINSVTVSKPTVGPLLLQTTRRIVNVTIRHDERQFGKSGYTFGKLVKAFFDNLLTNSDLPLRFLSFAGMVSFAASIILAVNYIVGYLRYGSSIAGWTSSIVLILLFGGMLLFAIGIIGRYLANIMQETKKMPPYIVRREDIVEED